MRGNTLADDPTGRLPCITRGSPALTPPRACAPPAASEFIQPRYFHRFPTGVRRLPFEPDPSNKRVDAALPAATPSESPQRQSSSGHFSKSEAVIQLEAPQVEALPQSPRGALGGARLPLFPGSCPQTKRRPTYKTHASLVG
ncbi:unnamed protein product [Prorocentrum cordatum]|uniref:Uncharacterized protein n=1 Tax=Prorocentrum cordatum TaxID=2364126 RepID=A0ABN9YCV7_9DINO|nr:unnamed protein product [Polarella glacialis]